MIKALGNFDIKSIFRMGAIQIVDLNYRVFPQIN